ncbi:hypothetical protein [Leifsonia sp. Root112D2]|nr:hypothetical protein [Leifsonia sp. Root112D2]
MSETLETDAAATQPKAPAAASGLTILGSPDATACEGDACLVPGAAPRD